MTVTSRLNTHCLPIAQILFLKPKHPLLCHLSFSSRFILYYHFTMEKQLIRARVELFLMYPSYIFPQLSYTYTNIQVIHIPTSKK